MTPPSIRNYLCGVKLLHVTLGYSFPNLSSHEIQATLQGIDAGERMVLGGDLNCVMNEIDKRGGRSFEQKKTVIQEIKTLMRTHNLIDTWSCKHPNEQAFTWNNSSLPFYIKKYGISNPKRYNCAKYFFRSLCYNSVNVPRK